ncbi:hypothetical protein C8R45DRAFT_942548 [Mycena sanguinolenta]|nr:hypothetical protein C8R45DRAFT_942548 [Mycena sanguinolenta]
MCRGKARARLWQVPDHHLNIDKTRHDNDACLMMMAKGGGITGTGGASEEVYGLQSDASRWNEGADEVKYTTRPCMLDRVDIELLVLGNTFPPTRLLIQPLHTPALPRLLMLSSMCGATAVCYSSQPSTISSHGESRWAPPPPLLPHWRGRREAGAGEKKEEIYGHSLPQRADTLTIHSGSHRTHDLFAFSPPHTTPTATSTPHLLPQTLRAGAYQDGGNGTG